ncbi:unnamed protein product [Calypogeia fissa]
MEHRYSSQSSSRRCTLCALLMADEEEVVPMEHLYAQLHINAALSRRCDYSQACKELSGILRKVYVRAPKAVQFTIYNDVLSAFRLLPEMDTFQQLSAAEVLLQAVEATLPKKRRIAAASEYKQAAVAQNRKAKHQEFERPADYVHLTTDLLLKIFGFLDPRSLAISSGVCRIWNEAAYDDGLWRTHFLSMFDRLNIERESMSLNSMFRCGGLDQSQNFVGADGERHGFWRKALAWKLSRPGHLERLSISNRVLCMGCKTLYWLSEPPGVQNKRRNCRHQQYTARPVPVGKVLDFILNELSMSSSSSSSDSDTDEDLRQRYGLSRSWAYPKIEQNYLRSTASSVQKFYRLSIS